MIYRAEGSKDTEHGRMSAAHEKALLLVLKNIETHVVQQNEALWLTSLRLLYVEELKRNGYENENYRSEKLLKRLRNNPIKDRVSFARVRQSDAISSWLVHRSNITISEALEQALPSWKYRQVRRRRSSSSKALPWPPTS